MENGQADQSGIVFCNVRSRQLREALQNLESASALISVLINEEVARSKDPGKLDQLYSAKGAVTCAIEAAQKRLSDKH